MNFVQILEDGTPKEMPQYRVQKFLNKDLNLGIRPLGEIPADRITKIYETLARHNIFPLETIEDPSYDTQVEKLSAPEIVKKRGKWVKQKSVIPLTEQELNRITNKAEKDFKREMVDEGGLALIRWQTGEITKKEFLSIVEEIKLFYGKA